MSRLPVSEVSISSTRALRMPGDEPVPSDLLPLDQINEPCRGDTQSSAEAASSICKADITKDDLTGLSIGHYALGRKVGDGGMGTVFLARHRLLNRMLAVKFVAADLSNNAEARDRFELETLALGKLQHPNIVNAVDAGCVNGLRYLVTEFIEGENLEQLVERRKKIPVREACDLIRQAAIGLEYSHANGFVHRDIKPSNLIVNSDGVVKILDFGLVQNSRVSSQLTSRQEMLGTWDFLAPEQAQDARTADSRSDIYSLGCTLIFLLSGDVPFCDAKHETAAAKLKGHLFDTPEWLLNPPEDIPKDLIDVLIRMMAKSPTLRYRSAGEVVAALEEFSTSSAQTVDEPKPHDVRPTRVEQPSFWNYRRNASLFHALLPAACLTFIFVWPGFIRFRVEGANEVPVEMEVRELIVVESSLPSQLVLPADQAVVKKEVEPLHEPIKAVEPPAVVDEPVEISSFQTFERKHHRPTTHTIPEPIRGDELLITPFPRRKGH